jgi:hypothetical protein
MESETVWEIHLGLRICTVGNYKGVVWYRVDLGLV